MLDFFQQRFSYIHQLNLSWIAHLTKDDRDIPWDIKVSVSQLMNSQHIAVCGILGLEIESELNDVQPEMYWESLERDNFQQWMNVFHQFNQGIQTTADLAAKLNTLSAFTGKVVGLLSASPGALGGLRSLAHLTPLLLNLQCWVTPKQFALSKAAEAFDDNGQLVSTTAQASVQGWSVRCDRVSRKFRSSRFPQVAWRYSCSAEPLGKAERRTASPGASSCGRWRGCRSVRSS